MRARLILKRLALIGTGGGACALAYLYSQHSFRRKDNVIPIATILAADAQRQIAATPLPSRKHLLNTLRTEEFDVLVIGGGATGAGVALDSVSRGLKTALVEKYDFSSGTSSRSTKLLHGGVRYLQKAIFNLDFEQYRMVKEALSERANLVNIAPHLAYALPIMLPVYKWWQVPYFYAGIKAYDFVAGRQILKPSYFLNKTKALELFPMLKHDQLKGAIVYYDGQHDDARMNIAIILTGIRMGASLTNHAEVLNLLKSKDANGKEIVNGAHIRDTLTGEEFDIRAKCVINATGPYTDNIRQMSDKTKRRICSPSAGVHVVLPDYYSPERMGLLDPATSDGRVIFFLPWQKVTLAGTTDSACELTDFPAPREQDIQFILSEIRHYLSPDVEVRRGDVLSAWSGIRPLVSDPNKGDTQSIARNHIIEVGDDKLITIAVLAVPYPSLSKLHPHHARVGIDRSMNSLRINFEKTAGGKWTTYRHMAEETMDRAIKECQLEAESPCRTQGLLLDGAHGWSPTLFIRLVQDFGLENEVAQHLVQIYGDRAFKVARLAQLTGKRWPVVGKRLHEEYPYLEAEVRYAVREYACTAVDVLARRTRLAFLNVHAAEEALPRIIEILTTELGWDQDKATKELDHCKRFLRREMGLDLKSLSENVPINFTKDEINIYAKRFQMLDHDKKGYITVNDLRKYFKKMGERVTEDQLHDILNEVDLSKNAQVDMGEFLQLMNHVEVRKRWIETYKNDKQLMNHVEVRKRWIETYKNDKQLMSALKTGAIANSRFPIATKLRSEADPIPVERSGGGV